MNKPIWLPKRNRVLIAVVWIVSQAVFLYLNGIVTTGESTTYIDAANQVIESGNLFFSSRTYLYSVHILLLVLLKKAGLPYVWMYGVQLLTATLALICFIKFFRFASALPVTISALLYCVCPFFQPWVCFLYTDAMFANLLLIAVYLLTYADSALKKIGLWTLLLLLPFYRPLGILFIPIAVLFWLLQWQKGNWLKIIIATLYFFCVLGVVWFCINNAKGYFYPQHNTEANIICGYNSDLVKYITVPYDPNRSIAYFFFSNPSMTWRLFLNRLFKAFWMTRPYYSGIHNLFTCIALPPYYLFAAVGVVALIKQNAIKKNVYLLCGLLVFTAPIVLFCADWVNRFILPTLVFVFILMGFGVNSLVSAYQNRNRRSQQASPI
jgi:hypothetical protein